MLTKCHAALSIVLLMSLASLAAAAFQVYPGAVRQKDWEQRSRDQVAKSGTQKSFAPREVQMYSSSDSFEKVYAFYQKLGTEMPNFSSPQGRKLPNGTLVKMAAFTFDGGRSMSASKQYVVISRPIFLDEKFQEMHDVTAITFTMKK
jgi:hypothetical protein